MTKTRTAFVSALSVVMAAGVAAAMAMPAQAAPGTGTTKGSPAITSAREELPSKARIKAAKRALTKARSIQSSTPKSMAVKAAAAPADITPAHIGLVVDRVYVRGTDGRVYYNTSDPGGAWKAYNSGKVNSAPSGVRFDAEGYAALLFARGADNKLVVGFQEDGHPDEAWDNGLGGNLTSATATAFDETHIYVVARGGDGAIWLRTLDETDPANPVWLPWRSLGGVSTTAPTLVNHPERGILAHVRGTDGKLYERNIASGSWTSLKTPKVTSSADFAITWGAPATILNAGWRGTDNALYLEHSETGQIKAGGILTSGPAIQSWMDDAGVFYRETFVRGNNGALYRYYEAGTTPGVFQAFGGKLT